MKSHTSLLDMTPMVYKLLSNTLADIATDTSKATTDTVVVIGGQEGDEVSPVCWKVDQTGQIVRLCSIPVDDLSVRFSVCKTPQGFILTGGAEKKLCIMFIASAKSWVRLQDMLTVRQCHGSIYVKDFLYVLGGVRGKYSRNSEPTCSVDSMNIKDGK